MGVRTPFEQRSVKQGRRFFSHTPPPQPGSLLPTSFFSEGAGKVATETRQIFHVAETVEKEGGQKWRFGSLT